MLPKKLSCFPVIASAAKQSIFAHVVKWIASSQELLAMTGKQLNFMSYISSQALRMKLESLEIGFMESIRST